MRHILKLLALFAWLPGRAQDSDPLLRMADTCFAELRAACAAPEASLWGQNLYGPMMLIDAATHRVYANQPDLQGLLHPCDQLVDTGRLAPDAVIANTAVTWGGVHWATVIFPVSNTTAKRMRLFLHESFHRIQDSLGLPPRAAVCNHLDTKDGRIWFRLELEALKRAVAEPVADRGPALSAALLFRECRYALFPGARADEDGLEWNEGLAEFTGVYASRIWVSDPGYLARTVDMDTINYPSFTRSFAYLTGPLYGILLSEKKPGWQRGVTARDDFETLVRKAYGLPPAPPDSASILASAEALSGAYGGADIVARETERDHRHQALADAYKARLVDGPVLMLPFAHVQVMFDPRNLVSLGAYGTVYPGIRIKDDWGSLEVTDAALIDGNWGKAWVPAATGPDPLHGPGWTLALNPGWKVGPGARTGDKVLVRE